jgi:aldose 1-epimerase
MNITETLYAIHPNGQKVFEYTVENSRGLSFKAITYGATLTEVNVPDREGRLDCVILGYDRLEDYMERSPYYGALVGRFANRIAAGKFVLDGREYSLACNDVYGAGPEAVANHLHGGNVGYDKVLWKAKPFGKRDRAGILWSYVSPEGEEGYPGTLKITASYALSEAGELAVEYRAVTDKASPVNLTQHAYWNLAGAGSRTVYDQELEFNCPFYIPVDSTLMPTGELLSVAGTPFDFTTSKPIGRDLGKVEGGYDHCLVVKRGGGDLDLLCRCHDPQTGRRMEVWTNQPGVQFYSGNFMDNDAGAKGRIYPKHGAFTLETEGFPDSVNIGHFPSCILRPGQEYRHRTVHRFSV